MLSLRVGHTHSGEAPVGTEHCKDAPVHAAVPVTSSHETHVLVAVGNQKAELAGQFHWSDALTV